MHILDHEDVIEDFEQKFETDSDVLKLPQKVKKNCVAPLLSKLQVQYIF